MAKLTNRERENLIADLLYDLWVISQKIRHRKAKQKVLRPQIDEITAELKKLGWGKKGSPTYLEEYGYDASFQYDISWDEWDGIL